MGNQGKRDQIDSWAAEDYLDSAETRSIEVDPWSDQVNDDEAAASARRDVDYQLQFTVGQEASEATSVAPRSVSSPIDNLTEHQIDTPPPLPESNGNEDTEMSNDIGGDDVFYTYEPDVDPYGIEHDDYAYDTFLSHEFNEDIDDVDEPDPVAEFDEELTEPLYEIVDDFGSLTQRLNVDEFLASVGELSDDQRSQIADTLSEFSSRKLSKFLVWMRSKRWTGHILIRYLEFRDIWESNSQWWNYNYWSWRYKCWLTFASPYYLTRDGCYYLVQRRSHEEVDEIIDESWLDDWHWLSLWKRGFNSFASFAIFRAGLNEGEEWTRLLDRYPNENPDSLEWASRILRDSTQHQSQFQIAMGVDRYPVWEDKIWHEGPPSWFLAQNWYEPSEWHDNLGWAFGWVEASHPYLKRESLDSLNT